MKLIWTLTIILSILSVSLGNPIDRVSSSESEDMEELPSAEDARQTLARKLYGQQSFEDHTKYFILKAQKSDPLPPPLMMMDSNFMEPKKGNREEEIIEVIPIEKRIKRQSSQPSDSGSVGQSDFDRILESLSQQSQQLADQFQELKRLTENLADGLRNLQERAGVSTESLRASASTLGNDLRDRWRQFIRSVNDSVSNLSIEDIKNGLRNSISSSSSNDRGSTISPADQSAIDSVVSEILSSGTTTTESPLSSVERQVSSLFQGAENFFSRQNDQAEGLRNLMDGLSDLTNRFLRPRNERTTTRLPGYFITEGLSTSSTTRQSTEQS